MFAVSSKWLLKKLQAGLSMAFRFRANSCCTEGFYTDLLAMSLITALFIILGACDGFKNGLSDIHSFGYCFFFIYLTRL